MNIEFISYIPTPAEKHIGIATVKIIGNPTIVLRYKIARNKDNTNFYSAAPACKVVQNGDDRYLPAHMLDSRSENDDLEAFIRMNVRKYLDANDPALAARQTVPNNPPAQFHQAPAQPQYAQPYAAPAVSAQYLNDCPF